MTSNSHTNIVATAAEDCQFMLPSLSHLEVLSMRRRLTRCLCVQEALASELAARMNAMNNASDNAKDLKKGLSQRYNRQRQAQITTQLNEIVSGANA